VGDTRGVDHATETPQPAFSRLFFLFSVFSPSLVFFFLWERGSGRCIAACARSDVCVLRFTCVAPPPKQKVLLGSSVWVSMKR
jgi:hypothetical protein